MRVKLDRNQTVSAVPPERFIEEECCTAFKAVLLSVRGQGGVVEVIHWHGSWRERAAEESTTRHASDSDFLNIIKTN